MIMRSTSLFAWEKSKFVEIVAAGLQSTIQTNFNVNGIPNLHSSEGTFTSCCLGFTVKNWVLSEL